MFNVGGMELLALGVVGLVVLGPTRLPGAVRQAGSALGQLRQLAQGFQVDLSAAISDATADVEPDSDDR